ncbi:hypothetical protein HLA87_02445 [Mycoplasma miroungigenitalium]|uniref:Uncharacterized protein n=1 Tax=Mycoplasma miroungigenitalium TaxID=754515 RepID=A0A6M4J9F3_9MOLU|nr:hypothetical protein [Mycoplasma miroungigenitalium]QJR43634.1 hypothetical protein HLA87_02445 [Mycoplasma miroungigenitalium]
MKSTNHTIASEIYKFLKQDNPEIPEFSFQIIEDDHFNNRLVISTEKSELTPRYYGDKLERVKLNISLIIDKLSHRKQIELFNWIVNYCGELWETETFKILQKWVDNIQLFKGDGSWEYWVQSEPVNFNQESQEYSFSLELLLERKEKTNV